MSSSTDETQHYLVGSCNLCTKVTPLSSNACRTDLRPIDTKEFIYLLTTNALRIEENQ